MPSLTVFANFCINNQERLQRMKDSLNSFLKINPDQYIINVRGKLRLSVGKFLKQKLNKKLDLSYINSNRGWLYDSQHISKKINSKYVFFWIEDHLLISSPKIFRNCLIEMEKYKVDQLQYSFLHNRTRKTWAILPTHKIGKYIKIFNYNFATYLKMKNKLKKDFYTISCLQIFEKNFFLKVLFSKKPFLKRWPRHLPFDFEKKSSDKISANICLALPHYELFAPIDDDHDVPGYSLISRKKYPNRISRRDLKKLEFSTIKQTCIFWNCNKFIHLLKNNRFLKNYINNTLYFIRRVFYTINLYKNKK
jgi:hypothetical protein